jgi:microcystin-dependent protein
MTDDFPIGTVLPFAGSWEESSDGLQAMGWTLCNGSAMSYTENADLYTVIGNAFGADETNFYLPDLRGYFLRAVDQTGYMDPDGASRAAPSTHEQPGNTGYAVGSIQPHGVGPHEHQILVYPNTRTQWGGDGGALSVVTASANLPYNSQTESGDNMGSETRPVNMYVHFIIKTKQVSSGAGASALPGTVVYYAGDPYSSTQALTGWLPCDGSAIDDSYSDLSGVIHEYYGATGDNQPLVPDYRGVFLRGVDELAKVDPDAANRTPPRPDQPTQGNQGARVGSWQEPSVAPHTHGYGWPLCNNTLDCCAMRCGCQIVYNSCMNITVLETTDGTNCPGVSVQVRPCNTYVYHLVAALKPSKKTPLQIPVGTIIGYAGPDSAMTDPDWHVCNGAWTEADSYPTLTTVIGSTFGGDNAGKYLLPWYFGMFLRGVDGSRGIDKDSGARTTPASWAPNQGSSGNTVGSFQGSGVMPHTHQYSYQPTAAPGNFGSDGPLPTISVSTPDSSTQPIDDQTGSKDTRPANAYVNFFIKMQ